MPSDEGHQQTSPNKPDRDAKLWDSPDVRFVEFGFKLFTSGPFDVEHNEGTSNFEEQAPEGEPPSWAYPESDKKPSEQESKRARNRTVCLFQKPDLSDPSWNDLAFHPSEIVLDRTCTVQGIRSYRNIQPCSRNSQCHRIASAVEQDGVLTRHSR